VKINPIWLVAGAVDPGIYTIEMTPPLSAPPPPNVNVRQLPQISAFGDLHFNENTDVAGLGVEVVPGDPPVAWRCACETRLETISLLSQTEKRRFRI
jgi:hypothetical protein